MPKEIVSVIQIKEILRVRLGLRLSQAATAAHCGVAKSTVWEYERAAKRLGVTLESLDGLSDESVWALFGKERADRPSPEKRQPDFAAIGKSLGRKGMTRRLLWERYRDAEPATAYSYERFTELLAEYANEHDLSMLQEYVPGERGFVDYSGLVMPILDRETGAIAHEAEIFVGTLGASNHTYVEATLSQALGDFLGAHVRMFRYFGGVPKIIVPDQLRSAVRRPHRFRPWGNESYLRLLEHYGAVTEPARPKSPRDKAKVEQAVQGVQRWVLAPLFDEAFYDLGTLNLRIAEKLEEYNARPQSDGEGSRREVFERVEKAELMPLARDYSVAVCQWATANSEYHVVVEKKRYSVPWQYAHKKVKVWVSWDTVDIHLDGQRIALHKRIWSPKQKCSTLAEHLHPNHAAWKGWTTERLLEWAARHGEYTVKYVEAFIQTRRYPVQAFGAARGVLSLGSDYGSARLEAACELALRLRYFGAEDVEYILKRGRDKQPPADSPQLALPQDHSNIRGGDYYQRKDEHARSTHH